ncbi:MAG TPA: ATP-binding protein [Actinomycetota bacterium]|nr:ATP-binding protein [Actinomycetota bacterium]
MHRIDLRADDLASSRLRAALDDLEYEFDEELTDTLKLAATELVTNAVRHSGTRGKDGRVVVFVRVGPPSLLIKVCDRGPGIRSPRRVPTLFDEGGRGLFLVDALSRSWGTSVVEIDGDEWSCVWACFGAEALERCRSA